MSSTITGNRYDPLNYKYTSGADAKKAAEDAKKNQALGNEVTERGTRIVSSNTEMDTSSFLKILAAEMTNLDPTSANQDPAAQVTQMAQFSTMGVMQNLNSTMTDSAHNQMVGKKVIVNQKDKDGQYLKGVVNGVIKKLGNTFYDITVNGKEQEFKSSNIIGVDGSDTNTISNYRAALNSDFVSASCLGGKTVVVSDVDENKKPILVKGIVVGSYIDTAKGAASVKVKIGLVDDKGNLTGKSKTCDYSSVVRGGDLTDEEQNITLTTTTGTIGTTTDGHTNELTTNIEKDKDVIYYPYPEVKDESKSTETTTPSDGSGTSAPATGA